MMATTIEFVHGLSPAFGNSNSSKDSSTDAQWSDIELAERCLVSNLYEDAANLSSSTLHRLGVSNCNDNMVKEIHSIFPCSSEGQDDHHTKFSERMEMIEAAGMVLIQAHNELGRADELINLLVSHFGQIINVPPLLYVTGISLQISAGSVPPAFSYVEKFVEYWDLHQGGECYPHNERVKMLVTDVVEIYAVHMLERGCTELKSAQMWVQGTNLLSERKKAILDKLHALSLQKDHGTSTIANPESATMHGHTSTQTTLPLTENMEKGKVDGASECQSQQNRAVKVTKMLPARFHILSGSSWLELIGRLIQIFFNRFNVWFSNLIYADKAGIQGRHVAGGVATVVLFYALFRERQNIKRAMQTYLKHFKSGLNDFWQLAFGLQISPLVASQALPVSSR